MLARFLNLTGDDKQYRRGHMKETLSYPGQFKLMPDLLYVAIPRAEIVAEMACRGNEHALNDVCLAVAVVADAIEVAVANSREK